MRDWFGSGGFGSGGFGTDTSVPSNLAPDVITTNSLSYADVAGLQLGLERLPGEETWAYLARLYRAAVSRRDHSYQGTLDEISLHLGLNVQAGISISSTDATAICACSLEGVVLTSATEVVTAPLMTMDVDDLWLWRRLSDIVTDINLSETFLATLRVPDAPAVQLARQGNVFTVVGEGLSDQRTSLQHSGVVVGNERFNLTVPTYNLSSDGNISFSSPIPNGLTISYQYQVLPYDLVVSEVAAIGLLEPALPSVALASDGVLAYQIRESIQSIMLEDRSYWAR